MCPPKEVFFVVETIKPAIANRAIAKMNKAMITSISEKPFDLFNPFKVTPPKINYLFKNKYHLENDSPIKRNDASGSGKLRGKNAPGQASIPRYSIPQDGDDNPGRDAAPDTH